MTAIFQKRRRLTGAARRGFTLPEMMMTVVIFSLVSVGFISAHLFGLKQDELVQSKLGASDQARRGFDLLASDIRSSKRWEVGKVTGNGNYTFNTIPDNSPQTGNALKVALSTNWNVYYLYFFDTNAGGANASKLYRQHWTATNVMASSTVISQYITNGPFFRAENYNGTTFSNQICSKMVVNVQMEYYQFQYPLTKVSSNGPNIYDYYKSQFRLASHVPN